MEQPLPSQPEPKTPFWRHYWLGISAIGIVVVVAAGVGIYLLLHKSATQTAAQKSPAPQAKQTADAAPQNIWKSTIDPAAVPLGDGKVSTSPRAGYVDSCTTSFRGGGAQHAGSWINSAQSTWNESAKIAVEGSVSWPSASYSETVSGSNRVLWTNDLPEKYPTGIFPIQQSDPAFQFDRNPNHVGAQTLSYTLPLNPVTAASPGCTPLGPIGVLNDGVVLFNALDAGGRDAVAHEVQDECSGHPDQSEMYHYHDVPGCLMNTATAPNTSTLIGYALDGYGIYIERDAKGNLPTDADLDICHGRTSQVMWNGKLTSIYHYDATLEYPYTIGCFHGTSVASHQPH